MTLMCEQQSSVSAAAARADGVSPTVVTTRKEALSALCRTAGLIGLNETDLILLTAMTGMINERDWKAGRLNFKACDHATLSRLSGLDALDVGKALDRLEMGGLINVAGAGDGAQLMIDLAPFAARATQLEWLCAIDEFGTAGTADGDGQAFEERMPRIF